MAQTLHLDRHITVDHFVADAEQQGYWIVYQASWPNGAGWIALAGPQQNNERISLLVKFYPDGKFTSERLNGEALAASA